MSRDHLITTRPGLTVCSSCHRPVLAAVVGGLERHVDPAALNTDGQVFAVQRGVALFLLRGNLLIRMTPEHLTAEAPPTVMAEHTHHQIPDRFIDGVHMEAAIYLVGQLLGATTVDLGEVPPF